MNNVSFNGMPSLHAKIYIKHRKKNNCTEVWIGSANYTVSAFSDRNSEILACLSYEDAGQQIYKELAQSFTQQIDEVFVWLETDCGSSEESDNGADVLIPASIYRDLESKLAVMPQKENGTTKWKHFFNEIKIPCIRILEIKPGVSSPTRDGSVFFEYVERDKTVKGSFSFDLVSKITDLKVKEEYEQALKEHINAECKKRNDRLLTHRRNVGIRKPSSDKNSESNKNKRIQSIRKITLFDLILKKKMNSTKEEIKNFLTEYKNSYVGELNKEDEALIEIFTEV